MAGTSWPSLAAGGIARASDVEAKFDWLEKDIVPQDEGSTTNGAYDLGTTTAYWRGLYCNGLNPTTTAHGVAVGTTTVANNSDVGFEIAGIRSFLNPRLTTTQRTNLAPINGMQTYDSTLNQFQVYENGSWRSMGGPNIGFKAKIGASTTSVTTQTAISIVAPGKLLYAIATVSTLGTEKKASIVLDSLNSSEITGNTTTPEYIVQQITASVGATYIFQSVGSTAVFKGDAMLNLDFKASLDVFYRTSNAAHAANIVLAYERS